MNVVRLFHTVRHLKGTQIRSRILRNLPKPSPGLDPPPPLRTPAGRWVAPADRPACMDGVDRVIFLNCPGEITSADQWNDPAREKLWLYNLHYFDDLNARASGEREQWHRKLLARWVRENPIGKGNGWEPYPTSLRIVNWIKWSLSGHVLDASLLHSLAIQVRWLEDHVEWHLLGNHLLANAKALVLAGLFFDGREAEHWRSVGSEIFSQELREQILPDGGHFELSPMYHAIILEDLLDLLNGFRTFRVNDAVFADLSGILRRMRNWLRTMTHPDGEIAFFNDAAFGIAATPRALVDYADRLGVPALRPDARGLVHNSHSGYLRARVGDATLMIDAASVGPTYLPGHAHADTLSFELSLGNERIIVNGGTSCYGNSDQRLRERSTAAHSTVEIDRENSSEVWGGFRVGRRARVIDLNVQSDGLPFAVAAAHDGYWRMRGRPTHHRSWMIEERKIAVSDSIAGSFDRAVGRFHLGKGVATTIAEDRRSGLLISPAGRRLSWSSSTPARIEASEWHPEFGKTVPIECIVVPFQGSSAEFGLRW